MRSVVMIPARFASSRYPGKPLVPLLGKPMVLWVAELSAKALGKDNVYVATEDERIANVIADAGFQFVMTSATALTGTDRLAEAVQHIEADIYLNVQGDEPVLDPADILKIRDYKAAHPSCVVNGYCRLSPREDPDNVNIPKVLMNEAGQLVYMSRKSLPGFKDPKNAPRIHFKQVCIYAFSGSELTQFRDYGRKSALEWSEDIEILRFLELGIPVTMVETSGGSLAVDVPDDVGPVERVLAGMQR